MTLDQLRYFFATGRHEHLGRAAKELNVTPSTVSHAISSLEQEFGKRLFVKRGKNIFLSESGKALMGRADKLLHEARQVEEEFTQDSAKIEGHFRIAGTHYLVEHALTPAWISTMKEFKGVTGEIYSQRSARVISGVLAGEFDGGICFSPQSNAKLDIETLFSGQLLPATRKNHPIQKLNGKKAVRELSEYDHLGAKSFQGIDVCEMHPILEEYEVDIRSTLLYDSYHVAVAALMDSDLWALVPDWIIERVSGISALSVPKGWDAPFEVCLVSDRRYRSSRIFDYLKNQLSLE